MGQALFLADQDPTLKSRPMLTVRKGAYTYTVATQGNKSMYTVSDGTGTVSLPIRWTFGQGMQTWVFERDGHFYESLVSYYPSTGELETTVGDEGLTPHNLNEAMGRELKHSDTRDCFGCHSTNSVSNGQLSLDSLQPGVTCEHCHSGSSTHLFDSLQGIFDSTPRSLKKLSTEEVSNFCGQCHRTWEMVVRNRTWGEVNVRFQPYRLANSKCFDGVDPRISCIACHDPHQNIVRDDSTYDTKCRACHVTKAHSAAAPLADTSRLHADAKSCPVASANCVSCHMPKVKLPGGLITFTDHQIRIAKPGEAYPN
jgi:formate-dependent nitrite reductase cytochrome c552 subunit